MDIQFDKLAISDSNVLNEVNGFLNSIITLEFQNNSLVVIYQDGKSRSYYIKCSIPADIASKYLDLDARLDPKNELSYRANRELLVKHHTFLRMKAYAENGREFHDIIVEYSIDYNSSRPLKVWGGQHRSKAILDAYNSKNVSRYHGFRIYFCLQKEQRTDLALVSNTNISVSNDLFDRQLEETRVGIQLREWCTKVGFLKPGEDFPDQSSKAEIITVKLARTFIVNFFIGLNKGKELSSNDLDKNIYEPYLCESGAHLDPKYEEIIKKYGASLWINSQLIEAGTQYSFLHRSQQEAVKLNKGIEKRKSFKNKALTESVLAGWSYIAGLLQNHPQRLTALYQIPKSTKECPDPLNAKGMSTFHHEQDERTYRGLGTRSSSKDRQRMAQVFLAKSQSPGATLDKTLLNKAISQVIGIKVLQRGYSKV